VPDVPGRWLLLGDLEGNWFGSLSNLKRIGRFVQTPPFLISDVPKKATAASQPDNETLKEGFKEI